MKQLNNLLDKEFKLMNTEMFTRLERRVYELSEKLYREKIWNRTRDEEYNKLNEEYTKENQ